MPEVSSPPPPSGMRLLVVDDEPLLARGLARLLRSHRVTVVGGGRDALRLLKEGEDYDVILCDVMMSDLSGMALYEAVSLVRPDVLERFVFMSGGAFTTRARNFRASVKNVFIEKPIVIEELLRLLQTQGVRANTEIG